MVENHMNKIVKISRKISPLVFLIMSIIIFLTQFGNQDYMNSSKTDFTTRILFSYDYNWFFIQFFLITIIGISLSRILKDIFNYYKIKNSNVN